ncbi:allophanate hydrolase subunit 1 [Micromonospora sp. NPDC049559]|uniref:5-oxoprolinase subunit B family protein n=1 Tax=Micromonospora sp. NPDC049559 TaxID=3155923 RepID=UPI00342D8420
MRTRPCGDQGLLVELPDGERVIALHRSLRADPPPGLVEAVPAARTVLLIFDRTVTDAGRLTDDLARREIAAAPATVPGRLVEIPVSYDGLDLAEVALRTGLPEREVVARHLAPTYTVAFCGFVPGFGYLTGVDPRLRLPRRDSPRTRVPAGSVAIADEFTGIYPRPAPGGWHILGRTDAPLWSLDRDPPALLRPGDQVRFVEVGR